LPVSFNIIYLRAPLRKKGVAGGNAKKTACLLLFSQYDIICGLTSVKVYWLTGVRILVNEPTYQRLTFLWWLCRGCSPLPIPNREVKPLMADGTAPKCGRVGSCHIYLKSRFARSGFFYVCTSGIPGARQTRPMVLHPARGGRA
jgi:hypothetical protein